MTRARGKGALRWFWAAAVLALMAPMAEAGFILVDDMEGYAAGTTVDGSGPGDWRASWLRTGIKIEDRGGNQVMAIYKTLSGYAYTPALTVPADATAATVFFRLRKDATNWDSASHFYFGVSESAAPTTLADLATVLHNDRDFTAFNGSVDTDTGRDMLQDGTWQNFWIVLDNVADTWDLYMTTGTAAATAADRIVDDFAFQAGGTGAIRSFAVILNNNKNNDPTLLDSLHVDPGAANLAMPMPEPATLALGAIGALGLLAERRRRRE